MFSDPGGRRIQWCDETPDLPGVGPIMGATGFKHQWLKTDRKEASLGPDGSGDMGFLFMGARVYVSNDDLRSKEPNATCHDVDESDYDEACIDRELEYGRDLGRWWPWNNCEGFVNEILAKCRRAL